MPKFRLTLCYNVRHYSEAVIEAETEEQAKTEAEAYWTASETDYEWNEAEGSGEDDADALEPCLWVEQLNEDGEKLAAPDDDFPVIHDPNYAYRSNLLAFASKVAGLTLFSETEGFDKARDKFLQMEAEYLESDHKTLEALILEARKLTGIK